MNEILMYGEIGYDITDTQIMEQLNQFKGQDVMIKVNSPGGEVFQGWAIYNAIKQHGMCDFQIDGLSASMMTVIMLAGRKITASKNAMIMLHNPSLGGGGDSKKLKKDAELLDKIKALIIDSYSERTGISIDELSTMLDVETWLTSQEALEMGFIDEITDNVLQNTETKNIENKSPKMVYMNYKKVATPQTVTTILGLQSGADNTTVLKAIKTLKSKCISLETENKVLKSKALEEQKNEAKQLTALAINCGAINKNLGDIQMLAFEKDFIKTKSDLQKAISEVQGSQALMQNQKLIKEVILGAKNLQKETTTDKPKSEWKLNDYRKNAPKELENDRELYQKLIKEEFNK